MVKHFSTISGSKVMAARKIVKNRLKNADVSKKKRKKFENFTVRGNFSTYFKIIHDFAQSFKISALYLKF